MISGCFHMEAYKEGPPLSSVVSGLLKFGVLFGRVVVYGVLQT